MERADTTAASPTLWITTCSRSGDPVARPRGASRCSGGDPSKIGGGDLGVQAEAEAAGPPFFACTFLGHLPAVATLHQTEGSRKRPWGERSFYDPDPFGSPRLVVNGLMVFCGDMGRLTTRTGLVLDLPAEVWERPLPSSYGPLAGTVEHTFATE